MEDSAGLSEASDPARSISSPDRAELGEIDRTCRPSRTEKCGIAVPVKSVFASGLEVPKEHHPLLVAIGRSRLKGRIWYST